MMRDARGGAQQRHCNEQGIQRLIERNVRIRLTQIRSTINVQRVGENHGGTRTEKINSSAEHVTPQIMGMVSVFVTC